MAIIQYVKEPGSFLVKRKGMKNGSSGSKQLLLGARLHVDANSDEDGWVAATTVPDTKGSAHTGFIEKTKLSDKQLLKIFYLDVGQGDATLIEAEGAIVIIDGGPNSGFFNELTKRLKSLQRADTAIGLPERPTLHINAIIISHFDLDHYQGLTKILASNKFTFGIIYHNGLPRYGEGADKDLNLGSIRKHGDDSYSISTDLRDLDTAKTLVASSVLKTKNGNPNKFAKFLQAAVDAQTEGRLDTMELLVRRDPASAHPTFSDTGPDMTFEVLAPLSTTKTGPIRIPAFPDPHDVTISNPHPSPSQSHTINGNSVVLRLKYGNNSFLFGGDLNQPAQAYLNGRYGTMSAFAADVNKACHHGSSDFDLDYLKAVAPDATVFSSGDNGSHDHPLPDAMGAAAKHSRGDFPLVFSTELARETSKTAIKFGHINARSNGEVIVMAQKKEKPSLKKTWHSFALPFAGPFADQH